MQSRPLRGATKTQPLGIVRKILFGVACLISIICICCLLSFKNSTQNAMNGELIAEPTSAGVTAVSDSSFWVMIFDYFGNVTYLFPLIIIFLAYKLFIKKIVLKEVDFFVVGTFILGFDLLVLGLCALFSALSASDIGAGGILGDFFNLYLGRLVPSPFNTIIPTATTFLGLILFTAKGPIWYCDKIGELIGNLFSHATSSKSKVAQERIEPGEKPVEPEPEPKVSSTQSVFDTVDRRSLLKEDFTNPEPKLVKPDVTIAPSFGDLSRDDSSLESDSSASSFAPKFSGANSNFGRGRPAPIKSTQAPSEPQFASSKKEVRSSAKYEQRHVRIEPKFDNEESVFGRPNQNALTNSSSMSSSSAYPQRDTVFARETETTEKTEGPSTYITGSVWNSPNQATAPKYDSYQNDDAPSSTIIKDNRVVDTTVTKEPVQRTIISRLNSDSSASLSGSSLPVSSSSSDVSKDSSTTSTIIYKAGADHLPPTEAVGSPSRKSEVSTVITRTTSKPIVSNVSTQTSLNVNQKDNSISGAFSQKDSANQERPLQEDNNAYQNTSTTSSMFPTSEEIEENVINFSDLTDIPDLKKTEIKIGSLSSSFIPTQDEKTEPPVIDDDPLKLHKDQSSLIKESDESYEQYSRGVRGVNSLTPSLKSVEQNKVDTKTTPTDSYDKAPEPSSFAGVQSTQASGFVPTSATEHTQIQSTVPTQNILSVNSPLSTEHTSIVRTERTPSNIYGLNESSDTQNTDSASYTPVSTNQYSTQSESTEQSPVATESSSVYTTKVPFEDMSSLNGTVPYSMKVEPKKNPITSMPTVTYSVSTETAPKRIYDEWRPPIDNLARTTGDQYNNDDEITNKINVIDKFLLDFKKGAHVADYVSGPVITRFDLALEPGLKSSSINELNTDLQRSLMTNKINMIPAVPGTPYMGIEVPNDHRKLITIADVVDTEEFMNSKAILPMCLGVDTVGRPLIVDLAGAPHLLIAGTTGSGKSAGLNSMLVSLLLARSPAELRLVMVDPKTVEFSQYQGLPHLLTPIITDPNSTTAALSWLVKEQERRYKLISTMNVSNIQQCNDLIRREHAKGNVVYDPAWTADMGGEPPVLNPIPYIVLVIDEFADLMAVANSTSTKKGAPAPDALIGRLAAKARAAGIHLILATQTPRAEIITGVIRANMPSRIAYTVQNSSESRIILDENGAENLLGNGDMMVKYQKINSNQTFRGHGPYTSNDDLRIVVQSWIDKAGEPEYVEGVTDIIDEEETEEAGATNEVSSLDAKFDYIVNWIRTNLTESTKALTVSEIQTYHSVGYNRAKRIHNQLKSEGIIDKNGYII